MGIERTLAIIPARGGSKGIPNKNIQILAGKPLIAWTIEAARKAKSLDRILVSTDSQEIADIAIGYGAEVPFLRPPELALDETPGAVPLVHALRWLEQNEQYRPALVLCLQPTSPLRLAEDIDNACRLFAAKKAGIVLGVTRPQHHPYWLKKPGADGRLSPFVSDEASKTRRQDLPSVFATNGAIYLMRTEPFLKAAGFEHADTFGYEMPAERSIDIDTPADLEIAESLLNSRAK
ncbi:MAG: acylneuraminate cytidylyltransferase family protein [Deltaproteobacteria bacterium]|nr:acylneuraminate cytidylyltransferase family protein [Deltaproteobacteria bacterium]